MKQLSPNKIMFGTALIILFLDQVSKFTVLHFLDFQDEVVVLDGFFRFVHWGNTGAAWSMFQNSNLALAIVSFIALFGLYFIRKQFQVHLLTGQIALGFIFGGILGNLTDRIIHKHVIDFIYFYVNRRAGGELGFPAFNIADSAICTGVGLIFLISLMEESSNAENSKPA